MATKAKETVKKVAQKAGNAAKKTGQYVAKNPRTSLYIALGIGAVVLAYVLIKKTTDKVGQIFEGDPNIDDNVVITLGNLSIVSSKLTIGNDQAKIYAQQLLDAMNAKQPFYGTDEKTILEVFKKINSEDFKLIFYHFGMKDYNGHNSPPTGFWSNLDSYEKRNLVYWLNSELSPSDGQVYDLVKKTVNEAGFAF